MQKVVSTIPLNAQPVYVRFWVQQSHIALLAAGVALYVLGLGIYVVETQRVVAAVIPCILAGVWGFTVVISVVSWENVRSWLANWRPQKKHHAGKRNEAEKRIMEIVIDKGRDEISLDSITPPNEDDEWTSVVDADTLVEEEQDASNYDTKLIDEYVARLSVKFFKDRFESGTFPAFTRGRIQHFRCSPNGKWLVACHEFACLVYDVEHDFAYQILTSNGGARPSAEHAEWSPTGDYLLLRSNKELWLWKTPSRGGKDIFKCVETNFKLRKGTFKYIKWVNNNDFLLLMDGTELFIINRKTGVPSRPPTRNNFVPREAICCRGWLQQQWCRSYFHFLQRNFHKCLLEIESFWLTVQTVNDTS
ncbi:hypothetical protein SCHPADRAFT_620150 [Schizopora paradoxa]|uniref:WD40 repeat-like protein n=1 Tax=Schizopora paradoxa TaxID=27342 RepID=A0A0H2RTK2_9AGAM|nr:hypothetical protein SCHPADRAFT_620150 [Schizopora paradoxa]